MRTNDFTEFGKNRATSDYNNKIFYAYNDYALPLIANVQSRSEEELLKKYFHSSRQVQMEYLEAFVLGYRNEMKRIKGDSVITKSPLIGTFVEAIRRYARDHRGVIPKFRDARSFYSKIKKPYVGIDAYPNTKIRYGINRYISGKTFKRLSPNTVLVWEVPTHGQEDRYVGFANGDIKKVSQGQWRSISGQQRLHV